jgi:hypothetical protein
MGSPRQSCRDARLLHLGEGRQIPQRPARAGIWMRDDAPPGVNNIGNASIADLGLLHNVRHLAEIELDDA